MQKFILPHIGDPPCNAVITGQDARHICKVLRWKKGQPVLLTNGRNMDFTAVILSASPSQIELWIEKQVETTVESEARIILCSGMLKDKKMDLVIKHATQLGIMEWIPFFCERSVPTPSEKRIDTRMDRWQAIAGESVKQCRRSYIPDISRPVTFQQMLDRTGPRDIKIAFWENARQKISELALETESKKIYLLIGPEGGFSQKEIRRATEKGFANCSLGPRILRAETAAIAGCTLLQHICGDI